MKLKKITIHNLASIEHAVIDFTQPPLSDDPIFLISGPTGAGKSTILDAVCLALFAETPRLYKVSERKVAYTMEYRANEKGQSVSKETTISLDDKRQIMRRGIGECYAAVLFSTEEGTDYEAKWYAKKAYRRIDGQYQKAEHTLTNMLTGQVVTKGTVEAIEQLLHLTFEQFCRTTMLAQGEFTKFLQSNSDDKSQILEKLTGTGIYSDISKKIAEIRSRKNAEYEQAKALVGNISFLDDESVEKIRQNINLLKQDCEQKKQQIEDCEKAMQWLTYQATLHDKQQAVMEKRRQNLERRQQSSYLAEEQRIRQYRQSAEVRTLLHQADDLRLQIEKERNRETALAAQYDHLTAIQTALVQMLDVDVQTSKAFQTQLDSYLPHTKMLDHAETLILNLRNANNCKVQTGKWKKKIEEWTALLPTHESLQKAFSEVELAKEAVAVKQQAVEQAELDLSALHPEQIEEERRKNNERSQLITQAMSDLRIYDTLLRNQDEKAERLRRLKEDLAEGKACLPTLEEKVKNSEKIVEEDKRLYDQVKDSTKKLFMDVRHSLRRGDICPLCQQRIEQDQVPDPDFDICIRPLKERFDKSNAQLTECKSALLSAISQCRTKEVECQKAEMEWTKAKAETDRHCAVVCDEYQRLTHQTISADSNGRLSVEEIGETLTTLQRLAATDAVAIKESQRKVDAAHIRIRGLEREKDTLQKQHQEKLQAHQQFVAQRDRLCQDIENAAAQQTQEKERMENLLTEVESLMTYSGWREEWTNDVDALIRRLKEDADRYHALQKDITELKSRIALRRQTIIHCDNQQSAIRQAMPSWYQRPPLTMYQPTSQETENPVLLWQQFQTTLVAWKERLAEDARKLERYTLSVNQFCESDTTFNVPLLRELSSYKDYEINRLEKGHEELEQEAVTLKTQLEELQAELTRTAADKPAIEEQDDMPRLTQKKEELKQSHVSTWQQLGQLQQMLLADDENRKKLSEAIACREAAREEYEKWNDFNNHFGSTDGNRFRRIAQSFILSHLLVKANHYLCRFTDRYELVAEPGSLVILVSDRYTRQPPQYVKVLSGGESFMVSLALALALAQLNDTPSNVDTLFIDEGFGTLDPDCLGSVVETLSRLHEMGGRRVGIISHVDELRHSIATQIRVRKTDPTRSKVEVLSEGMG